MGQLGQSCDADALTYNCTLTYATSGEWFANYEQDPNDGRARSIHPNFNNAFEGIDLVDSPPANPPSAGSFGALQPYPGDPSGGDLGGQNCGRVHCIAGGG